MQHTIDLVERYYNTIKEKNTAHCAPLLHSDVQFSAPLATLHGKEAVLKALEGFSRAIEDLTVRAKCASDNQVMFAYDVQFPAPIGTIPSAVLMHFKDGLIAKIELFYDARPFEKK